MDTTIKILFAEDLPSDAEMIWREISKSNIIFEKEWVDTRKDYVEALKSFKPDIILSDYSMPGFDGMSALILKNEIAPATPFILVTGSINEEVAVEIMKAGADDYIIKQNLSRLGSAIRSAISKRQALLEKEIAREKMKESEERLSSIFRVAPTGIGIVNNRIFKEVNPRICEMTGYSADELIGKSSEMLYISKEDFDYVGREKYRQIEEKGIGVVETKWKKKDGEILWIVLASTPLEPENMELGVTFTVLDITDRIKVEEKLRKSEEQYRLLIENQGEGIGIVDLDEKFVFVNPAAELMFGVPGGGLINRNLKDFISGDQLDIIMKETEKRAKNQKSTYEFTLNRPDGEKRIILITATPQYSDENTHIGTFGVFRDITERKLAEEKLKQSYDFNQSLLKTIPFGMDIVDEEGNILFLSENFKTYFGSDAIGKKCWDIYRDDKKQCTNCPLTSGIKIGLTESYESRGVLGARIFEISHTGMIYKGKKAMLEIFQDITERKKLEEKIIESEAYYRALIDISPDGILTVDMNGNVTYGSIKAYEIFAVPPGEMVVGTSIMKWVCHENHELINDRFNDVIKGNVAPETREYKLCRYDGSSFWGELSSSPLFDKNDNYVAMMLVIRDITQRKETELELRYSKEKAEESDRLKTAFLHNISHEIRTPMNAIIGFSTLLGDHGLNNETRDSFISIIMKSSNQLLAIVSDILEISNIEAGISRIVESVVNVDSIIRDAYLQFDGKCREKGVDLVLKVAKPGQEKYLNTDKTKLMQILTNLIGNALKFTQSGKIEVGYSVKNENIEFYISDTGIGIPESLFSKIFDRFYQVENTISRKYEGTGIGLSITKAFVELLGGTIWLNSKEGEGSTFYFALPDNLPKKLITPEPDSHLKLRPAPEKKRTILVAEDDETNYFLLSEILSTLNVSTLHAFNGKEAVDICNSGREIDLIIMDIKMPVMDGYEATKIIKKARPDLPVIAQTAYAFDADKGKVKDAGCDDYISKPINMNELIKMINKYI